MMALVSLWLLNPLANIDDNSCVAVDVYGCLDELAT